MMLFDNAGSRIVTNRRQSCSGECWSWLLQNERPLIICLDYCNRLDFLLIKEKKQRLQKDQCIMCPWVQSLGCCWRCSSAGYCLLLNVSRELDRVECDLAVECVVVWMWCFHCLWGVWQLGGRGLCSPVVSPSLLNPLAPQGWCQATASFPHCSCLIIGIFSKICIGTDTKITLTSKFSGCPALTAYPTGSSSDGKHGTSGALCQRNTFLD